MRISGLFNDFNHICGLLQHFSLPKTLTLKALITTAAGEKFCDIFPDF